MPEPTPYERERAEYEEVARLLAEFGQANDAEDHHAGEWAEKAQREAEGGLRAAFWGSERLREVLPDLWRDLTVGSDLSCVGWSIHKDVVDAIVSHRLVPYHPCSLLIYGAYFGLQPYVETGLDRYAADVNTVARYGGEATGTALTFAALRNDRAMVEFLLGREADAAWRNRIGRSAADLATDPPLVARLVSAMTPGWAERLVALRARLWPLLGRTFTFFSSCVDTGYPAILDFHAAATPVEREGMFFADCVVRYTEERSSNVSEERAAIAILDATPTGPGGLRLLLSRPIPVFHHSRVQMFLDLAANTFETP